MNTAFEPGQCIEYIVAMPDGPQKKIAFAEYYYFSGRPEEAVQEAELFLTSSDTSLRLSACLIYAYANLSIGQIHRARYALSEVKNTLASDSADTPPPLKAAKAFSPLLPLFCYIFRCRKDCQLLRSFCLYCLQDCGHLPCMYSALYLFTGGI